MTRRNNRWTGCVHLWLCFISRGGKKFKKLFLDYEIKEKIFLWDCSFPSHQEAKSWSAFTASSSTDEPHTNAISNDAARSGEHHGLLAPFAPTTFADQASTTAATQDRLTAAEVRRTSVQITPHYAVPIMPPSNMRIYYPNTWIDKLKESSMIV